MAVTVEFLRRPWLNARQPGSVMGRPGFFYDVTMSGRRSRIFDYGSFLKQTRRFHPQLCHVCLNAQRSSIRLTVPSISGRAVHRADASGNSRGSAQHIAAGPQEALLFRF
ncbi:hypothetical protein [Mesorhizobium sp. WSM2239]|uniref:Uncharacterized protein n=2 Tax=unclassified Mesorhizobium TaxID=325217 RepID=A0AAU8D7R7_9HYPH